MKNKKWSIIIFIVLLIVIFVGYKYYCFLKYDESVNNEISEIKFKGIMTINHVNLEESEYMTFENLKFKNIFDGFERFNEEADTFKMVVSNNRDKAVFIGHEDQFIYLLKNQYDKALANKLESENVKDDLDFLKYMEKHNNDDVKFFMTIRKQKEIYTLNLFKINMLPSLLYVKEINGDYRGYLFKSNRNITEVSILDGFNKRYYFTFIGNYSEEFINEFMNSVIINNAS